MEALFQFEAPEQPPARPRRRNIIWDAFVEIFGYEPLTESEIKLWGKLTRSLKAAGATRDSLIHAAREYHKEFHTASLTPNALEKHYSRFAARQPKKVEVCDICGIGGGYHLADCRKVEARTAENDTGPQHSQKPLKKGVAS
jgi:hypothetical protein